MQRKPVSVRYNSAFYFQWEDSLAVVVLSYFGHEGPVDGDCVTIEFDGGASQETRFYQQGRWLGLEEFIDPATEFCPPCGGRGFREVPFVTGPITCPDCGGTGRPIPAKPATNQPGINDEIKPELKSKKLREW